MNKRSLHTKVNQESGAALVTVIFITFILLVACVAMLSAVGAGTANSADILAETKAYYAAESGLQATINVLRNDSTVDYYYADANPTLATKLPYNWPAGAPTRAVIGQPAASYDPNQGSAYSVVVTDPDNTTDSITFETSGVFLPKIGIELTDSGRTAHIPSFNAPDKTVIRFTGVTSTVHTFTGNPALGTFTVEKQGTQTQIPSIPEIEFEIDYFVTAPRSGVKTIRGKIPSTGGNSPVVVNFTSQIYFLMGSRMEFCSTSSINGTGNDLCTGAVSLNISSFPSSRVLYANITAVEPYRLKVVSTGYGPNGARKQLEGILQKDFFNGLASGAATTMIGPRPNFLFEPGSSNNVTYSGCDSSGQYCVPSFGFTDPANLSAARTRISTMNPPFNGTINPPMALLGDDVPTWQQSIEALDALVDQLRIAAQNSGRYNPESLQNPGSFADGTGITFCEGSCTVGGAGGGILVVTGKLTSLGGFKFKGMIIVTGEEGWLRNGGGGTASEIIGNVIIAPYNRLPYVPENHSDTFLSPRYEIQGGGASEIIYSDISATFDGTSSISNIMLGVSEK